MKFRYISAFIIILMLIFVRQVIIDDQISQNRVTSRIINVAGKQRMLSQMITKDLYILTYSENQDIKLVYLDELKNSMAEWEQSNINLQEGNLGEGFEFTNSKKIEGMFNDIQYNHETILSIANYIIDRLEMDEFDRNVFLEQIDDLHANEVVFLDGMENIVNQYDKEGVDKIDHTKNIEMILFWIILFFVLLIVFFVFVPTERALKRAFNEINDVSVSMKKLFKTGQNLMFLVDEKTFEIILMSEDAEKLLKNNFNEDTEFFLSEELEFTNIDKESLINKLKSEEKITQMEVGIAKNLNESAIFLLSSTKVNYLGKPSILITLFDITIQKNTEEEMRNISIRDKLTGLYNRYFLDEIIVEEMERSLRYNFQFSIFILDLDFFKNINDTWGHPVGDIILKETAELASKNLRRSDYLIRVGGEEFLLLMPHTNLKEAMIVADKIRREIEKIDHPIVGKYTASFGVAQWDKSETFKELYERADEALYKAKDRGRNRVVSSKKRLHLQTAAIHLEWKSEWDSGNKTIDDQHKKLLDIANDFVFLSLPKSAPIEPMEKIDELIKHVIYHFECEEGILKDSGYMGYVEHSQIHEKVKVEIEELKSSYSKGEVKLSAFFTFLLDEVLIGHMLDEDTKFFPFIKKTTKGEQ